MSLHIYPIKGLNESTVRDIGIYFLESFSDVIKVNQIKFKIGSNIIYEDKIKNLKNYNLNEKIQKQVKPDELKLLNIEFLLSIKDILGFLSINNRFNSKIFGSIMVDVFPSKFRGKDINLFLDLLSNHIIQRERLDVFFSKYGKMLARAYIDVEEDGEDNPLDVLYEYSPTGRVLFMKIIKAVELLSEEDKDFLEISEKMKCVDKNYFSSRLWKNDKIREYAFKLASENNVIAQQGSFKLYTKDKEQLKVFYKNMTKKILNPIFTEVPYLDDQINKFSSGIP